MDIAKLLDRMSENNSSDLYITVGLAPAWRDDEIVEMGDSPLTNEEIWDMVRQITSKDEREKLNQDKELNIAYHGKEGVRFRINIFFQRQKVGMVARRVRSDIPSIGELFLPEIFKELIMLKKGLVLMVGTSGAGKSTSIAAMLKHRNEYGSGHVVTIEDPIEFVHEHQNCIFTQREVGIDTNSWDDALKNTLRQRPDVIYIGEIRDAETMKHAMSYAETGHLCVATLHAMSASQAVERIANLSPSEDKEQRLYTLSTVLKAIIAQRLVKDVNGERLLALEILKNDGLIKPLIAQGRINEIKDVMDKNSDIGMMTFDNSLNELLRQGRIDEATALDESDNADDMKLSLMKSRVQERQNSWNTKKDDF